MRSLNPDNGPDTNGKCDEGHRSTFSPALLREPELTTESFDSNNTSIGSLYTQLLTMQSELDTVSMKDTTTYIGRKCSIKHDRKRDSASPARPVAGEMEKLGRWKLDFAADRLDFLDDPPLCLDAVRGRPNFRFVE